MERKTQSGYLVLADISGYTSFVAQTEIEHADKAISLLLEAVIEKLGGLLTISKLEGDAVFAYLADPEKAQGENGDNRDESLKSEGTALMEMIDHTYSAFRQMADELYLHSTCDCRACRAIPTLDLKFMVHHGEFLVQQIAGIKDVMGSDVNLVHRMLKNHVSESTGWKGYAMFTWKGLQSMQVDRAGFVEQVETYEHLGDIDTYVMDMHARYATFNIHDTKSGLT